METLSITIPDNKSALVKQLLNELGVTINTKSTNKPDKTPNSLTLKTIEDAHNGIGIGKPIEDVRIFIDSL